MERIPDFPGLRKGEGWYELAFATGDDHWPFSRVRVTPQRAAQDGREHTPNAPPAPLRVEVLASASLVDGEGQVKKVADRLLLGPESNHAWQFHADTSFDPSAWLDDCAETMIIALIKQARGLVAAADAGLLV